MTTRKAAKRDELKPVELAPVDEPARTQGIVRIGPNEWRVRGPHGEYDVVRCAR